jgi:hypothetical protein
VLSVTSIITQSSLTLMVKANLCTTNRNKRPICDLVSDIDRKNFFVDPQGLLPDVHLLPSLCELRGETCYRDLKTLLGLLPLGTHGFHGYRCIDSIGTHGLHGHPWVTHGWISAGVHGIHGYPWIPWAPLVCHGCPLNPSGPTESMGAYGLLKR